MSIFLRSPYNYDMSEVSHETSLVCSDPSLAQQQFKDESDINNILKQFNITGQLPPTVQIPQYGDFTHVVDYHSALNIVIASEEAFNAFPAHLRARFQNDPGLFLDFVNDENNRAEAEALGILKPREPAITGSGLRPSVLKDENSSGSKNEKSLDPIA